MAPTNPLNPPRIHSWRALRLLLVLAGLGLWFTTQSMLGQRQFSGDRPSDLLLDWTSPINVYLHLNPTVADSLLIVSSFIIDVLGFFLLAWSIFGPSIRPFLGLLVLFALRQVCQVLCALPAPHGMIWDQPHLPAALGGFAFPSALVTYPVANDFFFSGHTAIAVYGAIEVGRLGRRWFCLAVAVALFEIAAVVVLRAHWTMDVFAAITTALCAAYFAEWAAPFVDRLLRARIRIVE
jgi:hypothetical protein